ncbi:MAG: MFS transporter [Pseudomonadota bacterium]
MIRGHRAAGLTAAYYALLFAALGAHLPYWPVWLESRGLDAAQIGWFLGSATLVRIVGTTILPALADRWAARRAMIAISSALTVLVGLALLAVPADPALLLAATLLWALVMAPSVPLGEALGLRAAGQHGFAYAPVRAAGSIGFLLANLGVGALLALAGPDLVIWAVAVAFVGVGAVGLIHPGGGAPANAGQDRPAPGELRALALNRTLLIFALATAANQSSHMVYYSYSVLDWQAQGISGGTIGALWALGVLVETALMLGPGRAWVARLGPAQALALAGVGGGLRWAAMAMDPGLGWLWPLQAMHAMSFGLGHLAAMAFLAAAIPPRLAGSAQGIVSGAGIGATSALVLFLAGMLVAWGGVSAGYLLSAGLSILSIAAATLLALSWGGSTILASQSPEPNGRSTDSNS